MVESNNALNLSIDEPLIPSQDRSDGQEHEHELGAPFTILRSLIMQQVKGMAIPGTILQLRNYSMTFTFAALVVSIYELMRYSLVIGPLPEGDKWVLIWVITCVTGSLIGTMGTFMLHKNMILASSLLFCCAMAPITPNMIVLT